MNCSKLTDVLKLFIQEINRFILIVFAIGYYIPKDHSTFLFVTNFIVTTVAICFFPNLSKNFFICPAALNPANVRGVEPHPQPHLAHLLLLSFEELFITPDPLRECESTYFFSNYKTIF